MEYKKCDLLVFNTCYNEHTFPIASLEFINEDTVVTAAFDQKIKI